MLSATDTASPNGEAPCDTRIVQIEIAKILKGNLGSVQGIKEASSEESFSISDQDNTSLKEAAIRLRTTDIPVAFPTETVYGLGADATRSSAVQGIYRAKNRPSDNPLIVHVSSLSQIRQLFRPQSSRGDSDEDTIPRIYLPLIERHWPGPLTILLPLPDPSPFAPEVTAGLPTVGIRMPASPIALALIEAADVPLAAPSANASTKPSPTTAAHVLHDLRGRIDMILDGGPCDVGVESTVVDGLHDPPLILRPGGVSIEMLRSVFGWEKVRIGYEDHGDMKAPRAPGMKYKHYSPKARVLLFKGQLEPATVQQYSASGSKIGLVRTSDCVQDTFAHVSPSLPEDNRMPSASSVAHPQAESYSLNLDNGENIEIWDMQLGPSLTKVAKALFSALRALDEIGVSIIFVESVQETEGDEAAAIMNRLCKAAEYEI